MKSISKRASAVLGTVVVATLSAGVASAVWTSPTGEGDASATGYESLAADVTASSANANDADASSLFPGSSVTNTVTVTNDNPYPVKVTAITNNGGNEAAGSCAAATVNVTSQSNAAGIAQSNAAVAIPAHGSGTYNVTVTMKSDAHNDCQGDSFTLPVTIASQSSSF